MMSRGLGTVGLLLFGLGLSVALGTHAGVLLDGVLIGVVVGAGATVVVALVALLVRARRNPELLAKGVRATGAGLALGLTFGTALGIIFSVAVDNFAFMAVGVGAGMNIGLAIGAAIDHPNSGSG